MLRIVLKDGRTLYSERDFNSVFTDLFHVGMTDLENGFVISSDSFLAIENLPKNVSDNINKEMRCL